jgi:hypothetical protein
MITWVGMGPKRVAFPKVHTTHRASTKVLRRENQLRL